MCCARDKCKVNLNKVLIEKGSHLPPATKAQLEMLLQKNDKIKTYYKRMLNLTSHLNMESYREVTSLFNEEGWINRLENFHYPLGKTSEPFLFHDMLYFRKRFKNWNKYIDDLRMKDSLPEIKTSDLCLHYVAKNPINYSGDEKKCDIHEQCRDFIFRGNDVGYSLTHRLLMLLVANNGRGCYVISPQDDQMYRKKLCGDIYPESVFIAMNKFKLPDLFSEQILFCTLEGHPEFVKRHWLTKLINLQTEEGCFSDNVTSNEELEYLAKHKSSTDWVINNVMRDDYGKFMMLDGHCNGHTTTLVAGALSAAVRLLLEKFY